VKKIHIAAGILSASLLLSACSSAEDDLNQTLASTVEKEKGFLKVQKSLSSLEKREDELYKKIMALDLKKYDEIKTLSENALRNANDREKAVKEEANLMKASKAEFSNLEQSKTLDSLKDKTEKKEAASLFRLMEKRYQAFDQLNKEYQEAISEDQKLYKLLEDKKLTKEDFQKQIDQINSAYQKVKSTNDEYNKITTEVNEHKAAFFKSVDHKNP
jgi:DNA repair exonuclease SbcCD ATPase subunit